MDAGALLSLSDTSLERFSTALPAERTLPEFKPDILPAPPRVRLVQLARESATSCPEQPKVGQFRHQGDGPYASHELLAVLTFSYGTGIFTLERIYESLRDDILFLSLITRPLPHPYTLREFRRRERPAVISSLETFFQEAGRLLDDERKEGADITGWQRALAMRTPLGTLRERISALVVDRINQATWTDKMLDY